MRKLKIAQLAQRTGELTIHTLSARNLPEKIRTMCEFVLLPSGGRGSGSTNKTWSLRCQIGWRPRRAPRTTISFCTGWRHSSQRQARTIEHSNGQTSGQTTIRWNGIQLSTSRASGGQRRPYTVLMCSEPICLSRRSSRRSVSAAFVAAATLRSEQRPRQRLVTGRWKDHVQLDQEIAALLSDAHAVLADPVGAPHVAAAKL